MSIVSLVIAPYIAISATDIKVAAPIIKEIRIEKTIDSLGNVTIDTLKNN
jgi:K(+)-stimulated pyrophosphate-energized sodium pump